MHIIELQRINPGDLILCDVNGDSRHCLVLESLNPYATSLFYFRIFVDMCEEFISYENVISHICDVSIHD